MASDDVTSSGSSIVTPVTSTEEELATMGLPTREKLGMTSSETRIITNNDQQGSLNGTAVQIGITSDVDSTLPVYSNIDILCFFENEASTH